MRALKTGEDIYLLKMEYILFLLLNGNVSAWFILFISNGVHMTLFLHLFAHIGRCIPPVHHIIQLFGR